MMVYSNVYCFRLKFVILGAGFLDQPVFRTPYSSLNAFMGPEHSLVRYTEQEQDKGPPWFSGGRNIINHPKAAIN